jgi:predicted acylesterase/phospholipase RssA
MAKPGYKGLCISSGGYKGYAILGALAALEIQGELGDPKIMAGCSVGAVIISLRAVGWSSIELYKRAVTIKLFGSLSDISLDKFKKTHGLISNDHLRAEFESLVLEKRQDKKIPTLLDLHNQGYYLAFAVCDKLSKRGIKIDFKSHPLLSITDASLMSANMPIIFPPIPFEGMEIVDGALSNPFPVNWIDNGKDPILGICVYGLSSGESSFMEDMTNLIMIGIEEVQRRITKEASPMVDVLEMQVLELNYLNTEHSYKIKNKMFFRGYRDGEYLVRALQRRRKIDRRKAQKALKNQAALHGGNSGINGKELDPNPSPAGPKIVTETVTSDNLSRILSPEDQEEVEILPAEKNERKAPENADRHLKKEFRKLDKMQKPAGDEIRVPLKNVPDAVLLKCLMSQPVDILCQIGHRSPSSLQKCLMLLDPGRIQKLKELARTLIADEIKSGVHIKVEEKSDRRYETAETVEIKENHAQKMFDTLPTQFQNVVKGFIGAMPRAQAMQTVTGINLVVEGLKRIGIDLFQGFLLTSGSNSNFGSLTPRDGHDYEQGPKIEIISEDDWPSNPNRIEGTPFRDSDDVD